MDHDAETAVTDWVIDHPQTLAIFRELGIDYSCGGKSLGFACQVQGLNVETVIQEIRKTIESNDPIGSSDAGKHSAREIKWQSRMQSLRK